MQLTGHRSNLDVIVDPFTIYVLDHMGFDSLKRTALNEDQYLRLNSLILSATGEAVPVIKQKAERIFNEHHH